MKKRLGGQSSPLQLPRLLQLFDPAQKQPANTNKSTVNVCDDVPQNLKI